MKRFKQRNVRTVLPVLSALVLTACSINPFVEPDLPRPGIEWKDVGKDGWQPALDDQGRIKTRHVTVAQAREYARSLEDAYRAAAAGQVKARAYVDAGVLAAAAGAIGTAASGASDRTAGLIGLGAATLVMAGDRFLIASRKRIYFQGALALECVIGAAESNASLNLSLANLGAGIDVLEIHNSELRNALEALDKAKGKESLKPQELAIFNTVFDQARATLKRSDSIVKRALEILDVLNPLGHILLSKVEGIRLRVDAEIAKSEPDLLHYDQALRGLLGSVSTEYLSADELSMLLRDDIPSPTTVKFSAAPFGTPNFQKLQARVDDAKKAVEAAQKNLREAIATAVAAGPVTYSSGLFTNCALNQQQIGAGPLHLSKDTHTLSPGANATVATLVTGGQRPYTPITTTLPEGVTAAVDNADILTVSIDSKVAVDGAKLIVPVRDSRAATVNLYVVVNAQQQAEQQPQANTEPPPSAETPAAPVPDADVKKVQEKLIRAGKNLGVTGVDGLWGVNTRAAVVEYLKENFPNLKGMNEFAADFKDMESAPDFSAMEKEKLIAYVLALPD